MSNPLAWVMAWLARAGLQALWSGGQAILSAVVFQPLAWTQGAEAVVVWSRDLGGAALAGAVIMAGIGLVWEPLWASGPGGPASALVWRSVLVSIALAALPGAVKLGLDVNNLIVATVLPNVMARGLTGWELGPLALSPLLLLGLATLMTVVVLGLGLLYVTRAIHVLWLTCLLPWFLLGWLVSGRSEGIQRAGRELAALIFQQAAQVLAWWLATRLVFAGGGIAAMFVAVGSLWFMLRVPGELRRLVGLSSSGAGWRLW
jgi:hypothetical protein